MIDKSLIEDHLQIHINGARQNANGEIRVHCPKCSDDRKNSKQKCLSVNMNTGLYDCHHCGWKGMVKEKKPVEYKLPEINNTELSDKTLKYFQDRGISKSTIIRFGVTESNEFFPQINQKRTAINFNYFREKKLVNVKFRDAGKNFKLVSGAELIFYGLDLIEGTKDVIICEGEFDALAIYEAGKYPVVSVPNGASRGQNNLTYLDNCWKSFEDKERIILATDCDEPGIELRNELARRLGKERCFYVDFSPHKDANDWLIREGAEKLKELISKPKEFPLEGVVTASDLKDEIHDLYKNGLPKGHEIGSPELDKHITWRQGEFLVVTGVPGMGKSLFMSWIYIHLAYQHGWKFGLFSPENPPLFHFVDLACQYVDRNFWGKDRMDESVVDVAIDFISDHFFWIKNDGETDLTIDGLLTKFRELVVRKGVQGCLIDPYNYIEHHIPPGYTETQYISELLTKIKKFTIINDVHFTLVAHPTKIRKNLDTGKYYVPTLYDIAGSAHFFNKADNGIAVYRDFDTNEVEVFIQKIRFAHIGKLGSVKFDYNKTNRRYAEKQDYKPAEAFKF